MRVLVLTPYLYGTTGGPRSSFELWERVLEQDGITLEYAPFESERLHEIIYRQGQLVAKSKEMILGCWRRALLMRRLDEFDAVLVNREANLIGPALLERWIVRHGKPLIYHLDDPLYVPYRSPTNGYLSYLKFFGKVKHLCRLSSAVITNSEQHFQYARRYSDRVWLIPSVVDADVYRFEPHAPTGGSTVCVGWSGSQSTAPNLRVVIDLLRWLSGRADVRLHFIGAEDFDLPGVRYTAQRWNAATEVEDLRRLDIGLLPVPVNPWSVRKFYLKLVQYMALGIPPVCSGVGANPAVVNHGVTGFIANDAAQWRHTLEELLDNPGLRQRVGEAAAREASAHYTLQANADRVVAAFRSVMS